jgi:hypothetical protein
MNGASSQDQGEKIRLGLLGASRLTPLVKSRERGRGKRPGLPQARAVLIFGKKPRMENNTLKHIETLSQIAERVRLDVAMIAHRLETLQRNLDNAPSPCDGRAVAKVLGDFVTDLRDAIAPLR